MPAPSATRRLRPPITSTCSSPIRAMPTSSAAPSSPSSPTAISRKPASLADRLIQVDRTDRIARLVVGVRALKQKQYALARQNFAQSVRGPVTDLTATLLTAWALAGAGDARGVDRCPRPPHRPGLVRDLQGPAWRPDPRSRQQQQGRRQALRACLQGRRTARCVPSRLMARFLSRNGSKDEALKIYRNSNKTVPDHPLIVAETKHVAAGEKLPRSSTRPRPAPPRRCTVSVPRSAAAAAKIWRSSICSSRSISSRPRMAMLSLADLYEALKKPDLAIKIYDRIPQPRRCIAMPTSRSRPISTQLERTDEAKKRLEHLIAEHPKDNEAILALGNILRGRKQFAECADAYGKAIANMPTPEKSNWVMFYFRGICYERSKQWPKAEADLKKALRALSRPAARAQLSRLFLGRPGRPSRRRHEHDPPRRRAAAGRRLHRRLARLGLFPHRQLRRRR